MAEIKIAGILRAGIFSPNHIGNDAAILNLTAEQLRKRGCEVTTYSEEQFMAGEVSERIILNMCRERRSIELLQQLEDNGALVVNSGYGIENCVRERMTRILVGSGIPFPESYIVGTDEVVRDRLVRAGFNTCWVKGGDIHTQHREDVAQARHPQEAQEILQEFFLRGFKKAVVQRHLYGDLVKFYGVVGTPFFWWFYADSARAAEITEPTFDADRLKAICARCADLLDVRIYGGDCIVGADGSLRIIDFNDWPSFAPCRTEAAPVIARMVMNLIKERN